MVKRSGLDAWDISPVDFPHSGTIRDKLEFLLGYAILAPSSHNTQPWRFRLGAGHVDVVADRRRSLRIIDREDRQLLMSCGAALFNLRIAMRRFGWSDAVELFPERTDGDVLARVAPLADRTYHPDNTELGLFDAIPLRHTNRKPFELRPVSQVIADALIRACAHEGAWLVRLPPDAKYAAADLISEADREQFANHDFRRELSRWLVPNASGRSDGIPGYSKSYGPVTSYGTRLLVRTFDIGNAVAAREHQLASGSPMLAVLGTTFDDSIAWLEAGQAMQRMLLTAQVYGLSASFLNQPLELEEYRARFAALTKHDGFPQLILRLGYGPRAEPTPRRPLEDVLEETAEDEEPPLHEPVSAAAKHY